MISLSSAIMGAIEAHAEDVHVAIPARVVSYDAATQKISAQPLIKQGYISEDGSRGVDSVPVINEVPLILIGGGGFRITVPIAVGDTVLLLFAHSSIDRWLQRGGEVDPEDDRRHSINDAVAIPCIRPFSNPYEDAPTDSMSIGFDGGATIELGQSEIRAGGTSSLATKADLQALVTAFRAHIHPLSTGTSSPTTTTALDPAGTTILKGG